MNYRISFWIDVTGKLIKQAKCRTKPYIKQIIKYIIETGHGVMIGKMKMWKMWEYRHICTIYNVETLEKLEGKDGQTMEII